MKDDLDVLGHFEDGFMIYIEEENAVVSPENDVSECGSHKSMCPRAIRRKPFGQWLSQIVRIYEPQQTLGVAAPAYFLPLRNQLFRQNSLVLFHDFVGCDTTHDWGIV
jgi:hypothetical protein